MLYPIHASDTTPDAIRPDNKKSRGTMPRPDAIRPDNKKSRGTMPRPFT